MSRAEEGVEEELAPGLILHLLATLRFNHIGRCVVYWTYIPTGRLFDLFALAFLFFAFCATEWSYASLRPLLDISFVL